MQTDNQESKIQEILCMIQGAVWTENVYLDIIAQDYNIMPGLKKINDQILDLGKKLNLTLVVHNNYFYPSKDDKEAREVALAIRDGKKMYDEDRRKPKGEYHIMSEEEIRWILKSNELDENFIDEMITNNTAVAESIVTEIELNQALFPNYDTPDDIKEIYEQAKDVLEVEE